MLSVVHGMETIQIGDKLLAAHRRYPHINPAYHPAFGEFFAAHWAGGDLPRLLRKQGMPADFFLHLKGKTERQALEDICHHVSMAIYSEYQKRIGRR